MSVSGTYRPPKSRSIPQRPCASASSSPAWIGVGPKARFGHLHLPRRPGALGEERDEVRIVARPLPGVARQLHARRDVHAGRRDVAERFRDVRRRQPAGQRDRHFPGDRRGQRDRGPLARAAGVGSAGGVEEEALDTAGEVGTTRSREPGRRGGHVRRRLGREMQDLPDGASDRHHVETGSRPFSWTTSGSTVATMAAGCGDVGIRGDGHDRRPARGGRRGPDRPAGTAVADTRAASGNDVEPDRVGPGRDRSDRTAGVADTADLDDRRRGTSPGRVGRLPRPPNERTVAAGSPAPHQRLATRAPSKPCARQRAVVSAERTRLGDHEPVVRHELAKPAGTVGVDLERPQVPVVDADESGGRVDREAQLAFVVGLHERLQPERQRALDEVARSPLPGSRTASSRTASAPASPQGLELTRVDDELLGEDGDRDRRAAARRSSTTRRTSTAREDRDRRGTAGLVGAGTGRDLLPIRRDATSRRRHALICATRCRPGSQEPLEDSPDRWRGVEGRRVIGPLAARSRSTSACRSADRSRTTLGGTTRFGRSTVAVVRRRRRVGLGRCRGGRVGGPPLGAPRGRPRRGRHGS